MEPCASALLPGHRPVPSATVLDGVCHQTCAAGQDTQATWELIKDTP